MNRFVTGWVYGGSLAGVALVFLTPLLVHASSPGLASTFLLLPVYMLHQLEEHYEDRFRAYVNGSIFGGREALTEPAVFVINVPGVWGVITLALILGRYVAPGLFLIATYLVLVNGALHVLAGLARREYNPGVVSGLLLFLPLGAFNWAQIHAVAGVSPAYDVIGLVVAVGIHAAIVVLAGLTLRRSAHATA